MLKEYLHILAKKSFNRLLLSCMLFGILAFSQQSSVQVTTQFFPPYSLKLSDYATATDEKVAVQLLLTDITEVNRSVRLRMYIQGGGVNIKTLDFPAGATPIFLDGGLPVRLTNLDLAYLFKLENLQGISADAYSKSLPEGLYQFCFEVYDAITNVRLSQKSCTPLYLIQNDPPILNLPIRGEIVTKRDVQNIIFQWTPRHLNATNIEYEFVLKELWDARTDPQAAFQSSAPLYTTTSFAPTLLYGPSEPQLLPNKRYGWQVRAISKTGVSENAVFKNNGYSEIFYFTYSEDCKVPEMLLSEAQSITKVKVLWQSAPEQTKFNVQYRKKGVKDAVWFDRAVQGIAEANLYNLQADTHYEFRVGSSCVTNFSNGKTTYTYSTIAEFKTPKKGENSTYNCGYVPKVEITNREPLAAMAVNEVFTAGDFPVTVKFVEGANGNFNGWGYIVVPYLADTKLKVSFDNIKINSDYQLIDGVVLTTYDPTWGNVTDIQPTIDATIAILNSFREEILRILANFTGSEQEITSLLQSNNQQESYINDLLNNPNIPQEIKDKLENNIEVYNTFSGSLVEEATKGGPNPDGYNTERQVSAVNDVIKSIEKAESYLEETFEALPKLDVTNPTDDCAELTDDNRIYISPSGIPVKLPKTAKVRFLKDNNLNIPFGVLVGFSVDGKIFDGYYYKDRFRGYKEKKGDEPYEFKQIPKSKNIKAIIPKSYDFLDCSYFFFLGNYSNNTPNKTGEGNLIINRELSFNGNLELLCSKTNNYSTCLPKISRENFDNEIWGKYNYYGKGGFIRMVIDSSNEVTFLYSNLSKSGEVILLQYHNSEGKWYLITEPPTDCLSCILTELFKQILDPKTLGHLALDIAGMIPVFGEVFDAANGIWYVVEGDDVNATLSFASMIPMVYGTSVKYVGKIVKLSDGSYKVIKVFDSQTKEFISVFNSLKLSDNAIKQLNKDFADKAFLELIGNNPDLLKGWKLLNKLGIDNLAKKLDDIRLVSEYLAKNVKSVDDLIIDINKIGGYDAWVKSLNNVADDIASLFPKLANKLDDWKSLGLNFNKVDDVVRVTAQNGDEVAKVFKKGTDEIFEIADDFFVDIPTNPATELTEVIVKANTGETIIGGGFFKNSDGSIGFVEDVSSYGSTMVQNTIKRRGNLRKSFDNIAKTEDAHHLFPVQSLKENQWVKKGVEGGFEFNFKDVNGIAVEKYVKATGVGRHGPHPKLTKQITDHMDWWSKQTVNGVKNSSLTPAQTADYMRGLANSVRNKIKASKIKLNDLNLDLPH